MNIFNLEQNNLLAVREHEEVFFPYSRKNSRALPAVVDVPGSLLPRSAVKIRYTLGHSKLDSLVDLHNSLEAYLYYTVFIVYLTG
ncbi:hypothetical protein [Desulfofundulus sp.]|uniref:hypothetical protein n=1 Tax=Desulfofundulus sp. TaxID=2282750 RepID=UPI003C755B64